MAEPRLYEGLFLLNSQALATDFSAGLDHLRSILDRSEAEVIVMKKWAERRLAYKIKSQKRGVYILVYFKAAPKEIAQIERRCNLSEMIIRSMVISAEHMGETELELAKRDSELATEEKLRSGSELSTTVPETAASPSKTATADA